MNENTSNITGDNNINLQEISARDIIINIAKDLPAEVKQQKQALNEKIKSLVEKLAAIDEKISGQPQANSFTPPENDPGYDAVRWRRLLQALRHQGCVLFIGPEVSTNADGKSLHTEFYKALAKDFDDIQFLEHEGFFSPESDEEILYDILDFYSKDFPKKNIAGRKILEKLAEVPFSLIISLCPDDTMHKVFNDYGVNHEFLAYDGTKQEVDSINPEKPVIYNILGNATSNGRYIFTHENFYNYLNKISVPSGIKKKIQEATHYLFIGFDFDKWYNRLLLFILDFEQKKSGAHRMTVGNKNMQQEIERFIEKQFNITFIENDYSQFIDWLLHNVAEEGIKKNLNKDFVQNNFTRLKSLSNKVGSEDNTDELLKFEEQTSEIGKSIEKFQQRITA
ncbi:MAG: SIR2 family protein [Bacteroidales bacterium]|nr:SIR2 family protein [Bacteroidales bacterium]